MRQEVASILMSIFRGRWLLINFARDDIHHIGEEMMAALEFCHVFFGFTYWKGKKILPGNVITEMSKTESESCIISHSMYTRKY